MPLIICCGLCNFYIVRCHSSFFNCCEAQEVTKGKKSTLLDDSLGLGIYAKVHDLTKKSLPGLHQLFSSECNSQSKQTMTKKPT